jgi:hypothetical protein
MQEFPHHYTVTAKASTASDVDWKPIALPLYLRHHRRNSVDQVIAGRRKRCSSPRLATV